MKTEPTVKILLDGHHYNVTQVERCGIESDRFSVHDIHGKYVGAVTWDMEYVCSYDSDNNCRATVHENHMKTTNHAMRWAINVMIGDY